MICYSAVNAHHSDQASLVKCCPTNHLTPIQLTFGILRTIHYINITWASCHYNDIIVSAMASQITILTMINLLSRLFRLRSKKTPKRCHWPLWGEFTGDRWIPRTKGQEHGKCFHLMTSSCVCFFNCQLWITTRSNSKSHNTGPLWRDSTGFRNEVQVTVLITRYL